MKEKSLHLQIISRQAWRDWLQTNHTTAKEAWLYIYKKHALDKGISLEDAVEEALCFGWIDSSMHGVDEDKYTLRFSPRRKGAVWAESNIKKVEKLIAEGKMTPAGMATVEEARQRANDALTRSSNG